jgi:S1-C subfamily serine protease
MKSNWRTTIYSILIAVVIGAISGILGTAWTSSYLSDYAVQLSELTAPLRLSQERPRNFPSSYKEALERFIETSLPSVIEVYQGTPGVLGYESDGRAHIGVVLTSDGWLAVLMPNGANAFKGARVRIRGQMYSVVESVFDSSTQVQFVKVDASGLSVAAFGKGRDARVGEQVFVATGAAEVSPASVASHLWPVGLSVSSDAPNRKLLLDKEVANGSIVFNLSGDLIGLMQTENQILPIEPVLPALRSLLEQQKIVLPSFGVSYMDLSHALNISPTLSRSYRNGALLYGALSVARGGSAKLAGLKVDDILLSINGESISESRGLDELIEQYRPGDVVQALFDRVGETQTVEVKLGERKE